MAEESHAPSMITFRPATHSDIEEVVDLVQSAYRGESSRQGWTTEADLIEGQRVDAQMLDEVLDQAESMILSMWRGQTLVACCELRNNPAATQAYLGMFAVRPDLQGSGLGRRVLGEVERIARNDWAARSIEITVIGARAELIAWYERRGFVRTGETSEFPYGDDRFGVPTRPDLDFVHLVKVVQSDSAANPKR